MANWNLFHPELSGGKISPHLLHRAPLWPHLAVNSSVFLRQETPPKVAHLAGEPSSLTPKVSLSGYRPGGLTHGVNGNPPVVFVWSKHRGKKKLRTVIFHFCKTGLKPFVSFFKDGVVVKKGA